MNKVQLKQAINAEATKYLGFTMEFVGMTHRTKGELETCLNKMYSINKLVREANQVKGKYTAKQWEVALIFGVGETGVAQEDLNYVDTHLRMANDLWLTNLWR